MPMNTSPQERKQGMSTAATKLVIISAAGDRSLVENDLHRCLKQIGIFIVQNCSSIWHRYIGARILRAFFTPS